MQHNEYTCDWCFEEIIFPIDMNGKQYCRMECSTSDSQFESSFERIEEQALEDSQHAR